jgi:hypothetical protein
MPIFGFLGFATGIALVYAGWLGVAPTVIVRDLFTGKPLPKRRPVLPKPTEPSTTEPSSSMQAPTIISAPIYPNVGA